MNSNSHRFGFVALAGPPNVGKSTLLNRMVGEKIAITSRRPQTTRHRILGIKTESEFQIVFVDTPGIHSAKGKRLNKVIVKTAMTSLSDVDLILFMIDCHGWDSTLEMVLKQVAAKNLPIILLINKIDRVKDKRKLLPLMEESSSKHNFLEIIPLSSLGAGKDEILRVSKTIATHLPAGPPGFPADQLTDRSDTFLASELVREQTYSLLGQELPYSSAVEIVKFEKNQRNVLCIDATIWVDKESQKSIVVGKNGQMLKMIGINARKQMELVIHEKVYLNLWVKVKKGWADSVKHLNSLGYNEI